MRLVLGREHAKLISIQADVIVVVMLVGYCTEKTGAAVKAPPQSSLEQHTTITESAESARRQTKTVHIALATVYR